MWWHDIPKEREDKLIEDSAKYVVNHRLSDVMHFLVQFAGPLGRLGSEVGLAVFGMYMDYLGTDEYLAVYRKEGNIKRLLQRIEELQKDQKKKLDPGTKSLKSE